MVAIPLASKSDPARSELVSGERLTNAYAEKSPEGSDVPFAVYRSPGLTPFYTEASALSRGMFPLINVEGADTLLSVHGSSLLEIDSDGVAAVRGSVFGTGDVIFARNMKALTPQVAIVDAVEGVFILESGAVTQVTDPDLLGVPNSCDFLNGYVLLGFDDGRFQGSNLNEALAYSGLNFGTADGHPDGMRRLKVFAQQVFLFGAEATEIWVYDAREDFPFVRLKGAVIPLGICGREAVCDVSGKLYFVDNFGIPRRVDAGYTPQRIGNAGVEQDIQAALQAGETIRMWGYLDGGHEFVVISSQSWTWVYDNVLGIWHDRKSHRYDYWQARHYARIFGKHLVASATQGGIYELDKDAFSEDGTDLIWTIRTPVVRDFPLGASIHELNLLVETGNGLGASGATEDQNPVLAMRMSRDGYRTWSTEQRASLGTQGQFRKKVRFTRLGAVGEHGVAFEFSCSAAVATAIIKADARADARAG